MNQIRVNIICEWKISLFCSNFIETIFFNYAKIRKYLTADLEYKND